MPKRLSDEQKRQITHLLQDDVPTPADETIKDSVKRALRLSDEELQELGEEIADYVEAYFENLLRARCQP